MITTHRTVLITIIFFSHFYGYLKAQDNTYYPDKNLPGNLPVIFSQGIISNPETHEDGITFSHDGKSILFTRTEKNRQDKEISNIYIMKKQEGSWSDPVKLPFNSNVIDKNPAFSEDNNHIYFFSERRKPGITSFIGEIWKVQKKNDGWKKAVYPENILNKTWIDSPSFTRDGRLYFSSYRNNRIGIFYSDKINGEYQEPVMLPDEINGVAGATNPAINKNDSILVFEGKYSGYDYTEIYISFKTTSGIWEPAHKLNELVNQDKTETNASVSPDGRYLFFTRNGDIYWVQIEHIF